MMSRLKEYTIVTYYDEELRLYIKRSTKESKQHLFQMIDIYKKLSNDLKKHENVFVVEPLILNDYSLGFKKVDGISLDKLIGSKLSIYNAFDMVFDIVNQISISQNNKGKIYGAFDFVLSNVFLDIKTGKVSIIDYEWSSDFLLDINYIKYRIIKDSHIRGKYSKSFMFYLLNYYHIPLLNSIYYEQKESLFQRKIFGSRVNVLKCMLAHLYYMFIFIIYHILGLKIH